jgi:RHS repeat-associated protein
VARYEYGPDRLLSLNAVGSQPEFYLMDALNSPIALTRRDGTVSARYSHDAWGNRRRETGDSFNRFGFTGHEHDTETGLIYAKARYYDPETARFLSQDPWEGDVGMPPSLNKYLYAYQNPTVWVDPDGRCPALLEGFPLPGACTLFDAVQLGQNPLSSEGLSNITAFQQGQQQGRVGQLKDTAVGVVQTVGDLAGAGIHQLGVDAFQDQHARTTAALSGIIDTLSSPIDSTISGVKSVTDAVANHATARREASTSADFRMIGEAEGRVETGAILTAVPGGGLLKATRLGRSRGGAGSERVQEGDRGPTGVTRGGIGPVLKGEAGVQRAITRAEARGETVLGREITIDTAAGRTRPDLLTRTPEGRLRFIECKNGPCAALNPRQRQAFPLIERQGGIPRGGNAAAAGLEPGVPIGPTEVLIERFP